MTGVVPIFGTNTVSPMTRAPIFGTGLVKALKRLPVDRYGAGEFVDVELSGVTP